MAPVAGQEPIQRGSGLTDQLIETRYQIYFRTHRGGCGIEWDAAETEFRLVTQGLPIGDETPNPGRMRLQFSLPEERQEELARRVTRLGYSLALIRFDRRIGAGTGRRDSAEVRSKRWKLGTQRVGEDLLDFAELWSADEEERLGRSPHARPFRFIYDGEITEGLGSRGERRLSPCDAKFLFNISGAKPGDLLLDPYVGLGGIVGVALNHGVRVACGDIDDALRIGLGDLADGRVCIWNATHLPLPDSCVDVVVTEPPYSIRRRSAVCDSIAQMQRCVRPGGRIVMLVDPPLYEMVLPAARLSGLEPELDFPVRRRGFVARAIRWRSTCPIA